MTSDQGYPGSGAGPAGPAMLHTVVALRWMRPRLAAELAGQVLDAAAGRGDADTWLRAAGWMLHGRAAVGDAREAAIDVLADMELRAGAQPLRADGAGRLRVELAALAQANGDPELARDLVEDWVPAPDGPAVDDPSGGAERTELELDRLAVLVRCALVEGVEDLTGLRADVEAAGARVSAEAAGLVELLLGSIHRDDGEPAAAAARALRGLARLGWTPAEPSSTPTSPHLGCALLSQWVTAVLEAGTASDIPDGVKQLTVTDGGRHGVLWRLAVARAFAGQARPTADVLEDAAAAAAEVDAPSLEAACRSAQAELFEGAGRYQEALTAVRSAMAAERTDRDRARRLRDALSGAVASLEADPVPAPAAATTGPPPATPPTPLSSPASESVGPPMPADDPAADDRPPNGHVRGAAGSALATLDIDLGRFDDPAPSGRSDGAVREGAVADGAVPDGAVLDGAATAPPGPVLGIGVGEIPVGTDATDATPLGDALLAELHATARGYAEPPLVQSVNGAEPGDRADEVSPPSAPEDGLAIVLDLLDPSDGPLEHADLTDVAADLVARATRLVPPGSCVRGAADAPDDAVATISVPEAGEVVAALWARSLVSHVAGRVARRGLPDGARVRARVVGPDGRPRGAATSAVLSGPSSDVPAATTSDQHRSPLSGSGSAAPALRLVNGLEVTPGSGGRRRKPAGDTGAVGTGVTATDGTATNGTPRNGTARNGTATNGTVRARSGRHGVGAGTRVPFVPPGGGTVGGRRRRVDGPASADSGRNGVHGPPDGHARDTAERPGGPLSDDAPQQGVRPEGMSPGDALPDEVRPDAALVGGCGDGVGAADDGASEPGTADASRSTAHATDPLDPAVPLTELGVAVDAPPAATATPDAVPGPATGGVTRGEAIEPVAASVIEPVDAPDTAPVAAEPDPVGTAEDVDASSPSSNGSDVPEPGRNRRARAARRSTRGRRGTGAPANGADPTAIPDDLGLGDLLAGALDAYRDI